MYSRLHILPFKYQYHWTATGIDTDSSQVFFPFQTNVLSWEVTDEDTGGTTFQETFLLWFWFFSLNISMSNKHTIASTNTYLNHLRLKLYDLRFQQMLLRQTINHIFSIYDMHFYFTFDRALSARTASLRSSRSVEDLTLSQSFPICKYQNV